MSLVSRGSIRILNVTFISVISERKKEKKWSCSVVSDSLQPHGHQAPPSMGFSRQEYWTGLPFPFPGNFPTQGSNPGLPHCRQTLNRLSHQGIGHLLTWRVHLSVSYLFAFSYCSWSQSKKTEVVCHSFLQWTTFYQNSPLWPICLGWPYRTWLIVWLS